MPRLVNSKSGVVVNVDDRAASLLGPEWKVPGAVKPRGKKPAGKAEPAVEQRQED